MTCRLFTSPFHVGPYIWCNCFQVHDSVCLSYYSENGRIKTGFLKIIIPNYSSSSCFLVVGERKEKWSEFHTRVHKHVVFCDAVAWRHVAQRLVPTTWIPANQYPHTQKQQTLCAPWRLSVRLNTCQNCNEIYIFLFVYGICASSIRVKKNHFSFLNCSWFSEKSDDD